MQSRTHIDLFSGIGGFALACRMVGGIETVQFVESNEYCQKILRQHWPEAAMWDDIETFTWAGPRPWLLTAGPPCQPVSRAWKQPGQIDDRWLWPEALRVVADIYPAWCLFENPLGIKEVGLDGIIATLERLHYEVRILDIPACAIGAKHRRHRLWILANSLRQGLPPSRQRGEAEESSAGESAESTVARFPGAKTYNKLLREVSGVPRRMDRIKALGNAIVPQVAAEIIRAMIQADNL